MEALKVLPQMNTMEGCFCELVGIYEGDMYVVMWGEGVVERWLVH